MGRMSPRHPSRTRGYVDPGVLGASLGRWRRNSWLGPGRETAAGRSRRSARGDLGDCCWRLEVRSVLLLLATRTPALLDVGDRFWCAGGSGGARDRDSIRGVSSIAATSPTGAVNDAPASPTAPAPRPEHSVHASGTKAPLPRSGQRPSSTPTPSPTTPGCCWPGCGDTTQRRPDGRGEGGRLRARRGRVRAGGAARRRVSLGVATPTEALELRAAGINAPVLAWLWPAGEDIRPALAAGVELGISSLAHLDAVLTAAGRTRAARST